MWAYKFEQAKLERLLSTHGIEYKFEKLARSKFGGIAVPRSVSETVTLVGVYHEQSQTMQIAVTNEVRYRTEKQPCILARYADASKLSVDDELIFDGVKYKVVGVRNIANIGVYGDISLEVVDDGGKT